MASYPIITQLREKERESREFSGKFMNQNRRQRRLCSLFPIDAQFSKLDVGADWHLTLVAWSLHQSFSFALFIPALCPVQNAVWHKNRSGLVKRWSGSFRAMHPGSGGNLGKLGNGESVTCRLHYSGDGPNPPSPLSVENSQFSPPRSSL